MKIYLTDNKLFIQQMDGVYKNLSEELMESGSQSVSKSMREEQHITYIQSEVGSSININVAE